MEERSVKDRLRAEYFELLPDIRRVAEELEAEVRHCLLPLSRRLKKYERLIVKSRVKECASAMDALLHRAHPEGRIFDEDKHDLYTLTKLKDLAGIRISAFPRSYVPRISEEVRRRFPLWASDPVLSSEGLLLAEKYFGECISSKSVRGEIQIVSITTALFWEIEHDSYYKPPARFSDLNPTMRRRVDQVHEALEAFEDEFERMIAIAGSS
jgi:ppGpp synthetase/RelA/SpoT-type nucleotidyltranferase